MVPDLVEVQKLRQNLPMPSLHGSVHDISLSKFHNMSGWR